MEAQHDIPLGDSGNAATASSKSLFVSEPPIRVSQEGTELDASKRYSILEEAGRGGTCIVYKVWDHDTNTVKAARVIHPGLMPDHHAKALLEAEAQLLEELPCKEGLVLIEDVVDLPTPEGMRPAQISPWASGGTLEDFSSWRGGVLASVIEKLIALKSIARGLKSLHDYGYVHGDPTSSNMLQFGDGWKLGDTTGIVRRIPVKDSGSDYLSMAGVCSPWPYRPPEHDHSPSVAPPLPSGDIYSFGMSVLQVCDHALFHELVRMDPRVSPDELLWAVRQRSCLPPPLRDFLVRCLAINPAERYPDGAALLTALQSVRETLDSGNGREKPDAVFAVARLNAAREHEAAGQVGYAAAIARDVAEAYPELSEAQELLYELAKRMVEADDIVLLLQRQCYEFTLTEAAELLACARAFYPCHPEFPRVRAQLLAQANAYNAALRDTCEALESGQWLAAQAGIDRAISLAPRMPGIRQAREEVAQMVQVSRYLLEKTNAALAARTPREAAQYERALAAYLEETRAGAGPDIARQLKLMDVEAIRNT